MTTISRVSPGASSILHCCAAHGSMPPPVVAELVAAESGGVAGVAVPAEELAPVAVWLVTGSLIA